MRMDKKVCMIFKISIDIHIIVNQKSSLKSDSTSVIYSALVREILVNKYCTKAS